MRTALTEDFRAMPARGLGRSVIVAFCWDNPKLLPAYLQLVKSVESVWPSEFVFVTVGLETRDRLAAAGYEAFTIRELYSLTKALPDPQLDSIDIHQLGQLDRIFEWRWYPAPPEATGSEEYHTWQVKRTLAAYEYLFEQLRPSVTMVWNGGALVPGGLAAISTRRGIPVFYLERGLVPDTLAVDPRGVNYGSSIAGDRWNERCVPEPSADERGRMVDYCRRLCKGGQSVVAQGLHQGRAASRERLGIPAGARVVLFPLQIETDTNILRHSPHYKHMADIIRDLQQVLGEVPGAVLVVKPHPEDASRMKELLSLCDDRTRLATDLSVRSVIDAADVVVTVNSTVGLEALVAQKPVVVLGNAIYCAKGFTYDLSEPARLATVIGGALVAASAGTFAMGAFVRFMVYLRKHCLFDLEAGDPWGSRKYIAESIRTAGQSARDAAGASVTEANVSAATGDAFYDRLIPGGATRAPERVLLAWTPTWLDLFVPSGQAGRGVRRIRSKWDVYLVALSWFRSFDVAVTTGELPGRRRLLWYCLRAREKIHLS